MKMPGVRIPVLFATLLVVAAPNLTRAQAPLEPAQLPPSTVFYLNWRGVPEPEARKANSLLALWDDPDFAPVRSAIAASMLDSSGGKSPQRKITPQEIQDYAELLENSFTLAYLSEPAKRAASNGAAGADAKPAVWNGMFFVYDRSGKEELLSKALLRLRAQEKDAPVLSQVTIGGIAVLKAEGHGGVTYWAEDGKYAVTASEQSVMEEILDRLHGKSSGTPSLAQTAAYQEAQANLGNGLLEFFLRIRDLERFATDSNAGALQIRPLLDAAKLDSVHSVSGHITFEDAKTHVQAAILGNTAPGTVFDIWGAGLTAPASLAFVPADAVSYTAAQINFQGMYATVKRVARAAFPQEQQGNADLIDILGQQRLGMPVQDALGLLSGEFASLQTSPSMDFAKQVYFLGIRKKTETLKLLRAVFSDKLTSERNEGDVTFLKITLGGKQSGAGVAHWNFFNLAVTPEMILGAIRVETLREVLANRAPSSTAAGLATVPQFQAGRAQYPENLDGLSYFDFQKVDWQALKDRWIAEAKKSPAAKNVNLSKDLAPATAADWLTQINAQVFSRHLHFSSSASWKDSKGIHWDQWVE